ncbi:MAG: hypothetical protein ACK4PR_00650 [Gammaproteobacteria bacterium]
MFQNTDNKHESKIANISKYFYIFAENSHDVIWVRSPDYKKQLYLSPVYEQIWGRPCKELYEHPEYWETFLHPDDKESLANSIAHRNPNVKTTDVFSEHIELLGLIKVFVG